MKDLLVKITHLGETTLDNTTLVEQEDLHLIDKSFVPISKDDTEQLQLFQQ